jgi:hypothetical protein
MWIPNNYEEEESIKSNNMDIKSQAEKKEVRKNWATRKEIAVVKGKKITVNSVAITIGMLKPRTERHQEKLVKFTKRKQFRIKFKEFRKKVWFNTLKSRIYYQLINPKRKECLDWIKEELQEHDWDISNTNAVDFKEEMKSSLHPPFPKANDNNFGDKDS